MLNLYVRSWLRIWMFFIYFVWIFLGRILFYEYFVFYNFCRLIFNLMVYGVVSFMGFYICVMLVRYFFFERFVKFVMILFFLKEILLRVLIYLWLRKFGCFLFDWLMFLLLECYVLIWNCLVESMVLILFVIFLYFVLFFFELLILFM